MFAGSAFVGMEHLRAAGYATRKDARKDFFQKTRVSLTSLLFLASLGILYSAPKLGDDRETPKLRSHANM